MKANGHHLSRLLAAVLLGSSLSLGQSLGQTTAPGPIAPPPADNTAAAVTVPIHDAPDPSAAIEAYGRAVASGHDQMAAESAFVRRMVDFGLPEMASSQAKDLI